MCDNLLEILLRAFEQRLHSHACAAGRFTPDGHVIRVSAEGCDILMHPLQGHLLVQQTQVLGVRIVLAVRKMGQMQETQDAQSVLEGNEDDIRILLCQVGTVKQIHSGSSGNEGAAVNPHQDGFLLPRLIIGLPNIQIQAVFTLIRNDGFILAGSFGEIKGFIYAFVRHKTYRSLPTQAANRLLRYERNTLVGNDILRLRTHESTVDTPNGQRLVVRAAYLFILAHLVFSVTFCFCKRPRAWPRYP